MLKKKKKKEILWGKSMRNFDCAAAENHVDQTNYWADKL